MTLNSSFLFLALISHLETTINTVSTWTSANLLSLDQSKIEFLLIGLPKIKSSSVFPLYLNLASSLFVTSVESEKPSPLLLLKLLLALIHSKIDCCNSIFLNLPRSQLHYLHLNLNSVACAVSITSWFTHISLVLKSLHWLKIDKRIHYYILSINYKTLQSHNSSYLHNLLQVQSDTRNRSSATVTLTRPTVSSRLKITRQIVHSSRTCFFERSAKRTSSTFR